MKRILVMPLVAVLLAVAVLLPAQPKVAVLDAVIPDTMDKSVIIPITDKIAEEIVNSHQYNVLDRSFIEQVLKEKEFQVSGMVQDSEIKQAGRYLGADYVVAARVSLVEGTYFISAKMINVETGAVTAQASGEEEGKAAVLIKIAEGVGKKLVAGAAAAAAATATTTEPAKTEPAAEPQKEPEPAKTEPATTEAATAEPAETEPEPFQEPEPTPAVKPAVRTTITVELSIPTFWGAVANASQDWIDSFFSGGGYTMDSMSTMGLSARLSIPFAKILYAGVTLGYFSRMISYTDAFYYPYTDNVLTYAGLSGSFGVAFPLGKALQVYAGGKLGYGSVTLGSFWSVGAGSMYFEGLSGGSLTFGTEAGVDLIFLRIVTVGLRLEWTAGSVSSSSDLATSGFFGAYGSPFATNIVRLQIGAGIALGGNKQ